MQSFWQTWKVKAKLCLTTNREIQYYKWVLTFKANPNNRNRTYI